MPAIVEAAKQYFVDALKYLDVRPQAPWNITSNWPLSTRRTFKNGH
jgi:hypothetical protein